MNSIFGLAILISVSAGSLFDPHLFPNKGPFFEGWYIRMIDSSNEISFGVLFGKVLPESEKLARKTWFVGIIVDGADNHTSAGKLVDYNCFPAPDKASITVRDGQPITTEPDFSSPSHFEFETEPCGYVRVKPRQTEIDVRIGNVRVEATVGEPRAWSGDGRGPMGWLNSLPLPLFWFVYSTGSHADYRITLEDGRQLSGSAVVHMEKNWGGSFPPSWIWLQGVKGSKNISDSASFALTYGPVGFSVVNIPSHLAGFRHKTKNIEIDFRPDNSVSLVTLDPCKGRTAVTLTSLSYKMEVISSADRSTFSECFYGPMQNGFRQVCKESFRATAVVRIFQRNWFTWNLIDSQTFQMSALEFGGSFTCGGACVGTE